MNEMNRSFPLDLLSEGSKSTTFEKEVIDDMKCHIINVFKEQHIEIRDISCIVGPTVVRFEFIPNEGIKIKRIRSCEHKLNEALSDYGPVRLIAPVPGKGTIAVEVPRPDRQTVPLREVLESKEFQETEAHLPVALGIDSENNIMVADLAKMPHLLIAGAIGQGKSVLINNIILSLLYGLSPTDLQLLLIDPKQVELAHYNSLKNKYLLQVGEQSSEVVTEIEKVPAILNSINYELQYRYDLLRISGCRTIYEYNKKFAEGKLTKSRHHHLPYIIVVIDEFADMMITLGRDFASSLLQITACGRAVGIHLIIATQQPTSYIISGIIKANFPSRIAFKVISEAYSKTILDTPEAEKLIGMGDMLYSYCGFIKRIQCCYVDTSEIESVCDWIAPNSPYSGNPYILPLSYSRPATEVEGSLERDPLFEEAARIIVESSNTSISTLQRRLSIGYARAHKLIDQLEKAGIVGPQNGRSPQKVLRLDNDILERDNEKKSPSSFR